MNHDRFACHLRAYFCSGWAFFIPYLLAYSLYAWLELPTNPTTRTDGRLSSAIPSLLTVFRIFHATHIILAVVALRSWRHLKRQDETVSITSSRHSEFWRLLPWLCLALIFWIPGLYLEWPSDPWEHLRRINEWHILDEASAHSSWKKSSYFLFYSITGHATGLTQLSWLTVLYTVICLLLSWQYYRLARAVGLSERASFIFVLINAITFGNNIFSFYRYYGLSSSIFAQIGAVALTRIALEFAAKGTAVDPDIGHQESQRDARVQTVTRVNAPSSNASLGNRRTALSLSTGSLFPLSISAVALLAFTVFNHIQGLGIAGIGVGAVVVWRLIEWKRAMIGWLALAALIASVAVIHWFPRHSALDEVYRAQGWLTSWYGFDIFSLDSPAFQHSLHILGAVGVVNLGMGLWLVFRKNHIVGWLTILPVLTLALPFSNLPFVHVLATERSLGNITTFHRFLFATPMGLAITTVLSTWMRRIIATTRAPIDQTNIAGSINLLPALERPSISSRALGTTVRSLAPCSLLVALALLAGNDKYNRFWHSLQSTPDDLQFRSPIASFEARTFADAQTNPSSVYFLSPLDAMIQQIFKPSANPPPLRQYMHAPLATTELTEKLHWLNNLNPAEWVRWHENPHQTDPFILRRLKPGQSQTQLVANFSTKSRPWLHLGGRPALQEFYNQRLVVKNPPGASSHIFNPDLVPIVRSKRYTLSSTIRQVGAPNASNYLAVAWYDAHGNFLASSLSEPIGAGEPAGWKNGTYSYYGISGMPAPPNWRCYKIRFGFGQTAVIPANAAFLRAGALLNYDSNQEAVVELTEVMLHELDPYELVHFPIPLVKSLYSTQSQAGRLSHHWLSHEVAKWLGGNDELLMVP